MKLPNKFEINTKYNRTDRWVFEKGADGMFLCVETNGEPNAYQSLNSESFVRACIEEGSWIITKDMDEPDLVFPFYVTHRDDRVGRVVCVTKGSLKDHVTLEGYSGSFNNYYSVGNVKQLIKDGIWIVKSVGEKPQDFILKSAAIDALSISGTITAPQIGSKSLATLTINVDMGDALAQVKALTEAVEALNISMESYTKLKEGM